MSRPLIILLVLLLAAGSFCLYEWRSLEKARLVMMETPIAGNCIFGDQPESPKTHSIYPHPKPPEHTQDYIVAATFTIHGAKASGMLRIEQPRPKGGWWFSIACPLHDGQFPQAVKLSPDWKEVLFVLHNQKRQQLGTARYVLDGKRIDGEIVLQ